METINSILLVDDDNINNYINLRLFKSLNIPCEISTALNGEEALTFLKNNPESLPDYIFLDIEMPIMNGVTFVEEFYKIASTYKKEPKIVVLKTTLHPNYINILNNYPIHSYIQKPLTSEKLNEIMENMVSSNSERY